MKLKQDLVAALGEFVGTTLFLLLALGGAKTAQFTRTSSQTEGLQTSLGNQTIMFIAVSFGLSLLVTAWVFYRVTGGLFNPAITFALWLIGGVGSVRAILLLISQLLGGIAGAALVAALTPFGGAVSVETNLAANVNIGQGLFIEAFLTAILVLTVLFLAAEKHKSTHMAPIGIGLVLLACHMFGVVWTGCGINPARSFGPSVVAASFPSYHWIYWVGPFIGSLMAVGFYLLLKAFDYTSVVFGQDADHEIGERQIVGAALFKRARGKFIVYHAQVDSTTGKAEAPATVAVYDEKNPEMVQAVVTGHASVIPQGPGGFADVEKGAEPIADSPATRMPIERRATGPGMAVDAAGNVTFTNGFPSMRPEAQDVGGIQVPGSQATGLASIPKARDVLSS